MCLTGSYKFGLMGTTEESICLLHRALPFSDRQRVSRMPYLDCMFCVGETTQSRCGINNCRPSIFYTLAAIR